MNETTKPALQANVNFHNHLVQNPYPGRGIIIGLDETGNNLVQIYWIMGRSENSRNRVFEAEADRVYTVAANPWKVEDSSLTIYNAMVESDGVAFVSNGSQTDTVAETYPFKGLYEALEDADVMYEPDAPNYTPRITAMCSWYDGDEDVTPIAQMSVLRKSDASDCSDHCYYDIASFIPGFGKCITTYLGDSNPLPAFRGEPLSMPLPGNIEQIADAYWAALNADNKVSLAVKFIPKDGSSKVVIRNKYAKVT